MIFSFLKVIPKGLRKLAILFYTLKFRFKKMTGLLRPPVIQPYFGYGNSGRIYLMGRLLEDNGLARPVDRQSIWHNLKAMYQRYTSDFIPDARIKVHFRDETFEVITDDEGYFEFDHHLKEPLKDDQDWYEVSLELLDQVVRKQKNTTATGRILVAEKNSVFGIISDIDDTILVSRATKFFRKVRLLLLKNAYTRLPFEGVAAFYNALRKGRSGAIFNPIFYVSSSSWKLYDLLLDFCLVKGIPVGPFMLRESRADDYRFFGSIHKDHKLTKIEHIFEVYSNLKFILIGDSGQRDAEIYAQVVRDYPGRVECIYIRDVSNNRRDEKVFELANELLNNYQVELKLVKNTLEAAFHAFDRGYITESSLKAVQGEKEKEENYSEDPEELIQQQA
jgi:phosphatidate phosphatase APP1